MERAKLDPWVTLEYRGFRICSPSGISLSFDAAVTDKFWVEINNEGKLLCKDGLLHGTTYGDTDNILHGWYDSVEEAKEIIDDYMRPDSSFEIGGAL